MDFREGTYPVVNQHHAESFAGISNTRFPETPNLILGSLPAEMSKLLKPSMKPVLLKKEQFLYQAEDRLEYLYFPETAVISEFKILDDGRMVEIAVTGKEGGIGLSSLFSDSHFAQNCTQVSQAGSA